jgi:HD superfamily phosphohydrolase
MGACVLPTNLYPGDNRRKTFVLPVSGAVVLYGPEIDIVDTREFQRLDGIRQLGTSYVVFRGANHTRFVHSIGALHEAERMMRAIEENPAARSDIPDPARRLARIGALLHDLPHVPFGHTLEDEFHLLQRHDMNSYRFDTLLLGGELGEVLRKSLVKDEVEELQRVLKAKNDNEFAALRFPFVGDIIGNTVCADLLDYVPRDLAACGMPVPAVDHFLGYLTLSGTSTTPLNRNRVALRLEKRGMPRPDVESEVIQLLSERYELAERVYFHHAKNAASVMIARAVQDAGFAAGESSSAEVDSNFYYLSDETLLLALRDEWFADGLGLRREGVVGSEAIDRASRLARGVIERRLFKIAYLAVHDDLVSRVKTICDNFGKDPVARRDLEDHLADAAGLERGDVLVHIPHQGMMQKQAEVRVITDIGDIVTLSEWDRAHSRRLASLNEAHERLWRITVYAHPDIEPAARTVLRAAAEEEFKAQPRYVKVPAPGLTYLRAVFEREATGHSWSMADWAAIEGDQTRVAAFSLGETYEQHVKELATRIELARETRDL